MKNNPRARHARRMRRGHCGLLLCCLALLAPGAAFATTSAAATPPQFLGQFPSAGEEAPGTEAGKLDNPRGVAASPDGKRVYVMDLGNSRVDVFDPWGQFIEAFGWGVRDSSAELQSCTAQTDCQRGVPGTGAGQFSADLGGLGIAADSKGDVFVVDLSNHRVEKFTSTGEFLLMFGGEVNKTTHENICTAEQLEGGDVCGTGTTGSGNGQFEPWAVGNAIAVGTGDLVYVGDRERIQKFDSNGNYLGSVPVPGETVKSLALDSSGSFYVTYEMNNISEVQHDVHKLSSTGAEECAAKVLYPWALATGPNSELYVATEGVEVGRQRVLEFNSACAETASFGEGANNVWFSGLGTNFIGDLYVTSFNNGAPGPEASFVTAYGPPPAFAPPPKAPPQIADQYAASVDPEGALLRAKINPRFWSDTTYYVQYGTGKCSEGNCTTEQPAPPGALLSTRVTSTPILSGGVRLEGLAPQTTYHYRFVAQSGGSEGEPVRGIGGEVGLDGAEASFTTAPLPVVPPNPDPCSNAQFRGGAASLLPDCRAYEMVSPVDKNNGDIVTLLSSFNYRARLDQASTTGDALTYSSYRAFAGSPSGIWSSQYLARRGSTGWATEAISPPKSGGPFHQGLDDFDTPFRAFSSNLETSWLWQDHEPALDPTVSGGFSNIFRRNADGSYTALVRATPPPNRPDGFLPELQGISADGSHALFRTQDNLTPEAPVLPWGGAPPEQHTPHQLYESFSEGGEPPQLRLVSVLPNKGPATGGASVGTANAPIEFGRLDSVAHAVSEDGSRVYWTAANEGPGKLYLRLNGTKTLEVSGTVDPGPARFLTATPGGGRALYAFASGARAGDLYEYDLESKSSTLLATGFLGFLGVSEDLSRYYFLSKEVLAPGATAGQPNLYLGEEGSFDFLGLLSGNEIGNAAQVLSAVNPEPAFKIARVSPDGSLAFMSFSKALADGAADYDNTDQQSGQPDAEVYHYSARTGDLACVSCNPTGSRPVGRELRPRGNFNGTWAAAQIPTSDMEMQQPRYLSDDGSRLFFESFEALVPRDTNGAADVYEWEEIGAGSQGATCTEESSGFSIANGGCLNLISTGESTRDSEFIDASPSGRDAFITTLSSLAPQDAGLVDIYDAREGGGLPPPATPPAACEGEACQGPLTPPNDPTPASSSFEGAGNVSEKPGVRKQTKRAKKHKKSTHKRTKHKRRAGR